MLLSTLVKLNTLGLAKQVVTGAFINGALIGASTAAALAAATAARKGETPCTRVVDTRPPSPDA